MLTKLFSLACRLQPLVSLPIYFYAALKPSSDDGGVSISATVLHFVGNILLVLSLYISLQQYIKLQRILILSLLLALLVESLQFFTKSRQLDPYDYAINIAGVLAGYILILVYSKLKP